MIWVVLGNYYNNWRIIMLDEELMKYSRELEEDLESDNIPVSPHGGSPEETS